MTSGLPLMTENLDDFSDAPLTPIENQKARKIIHDQERMDWLWASLRIWTGWVTGGIVGAYALYEVILKFLKKAAP